MSKASKIINVTLKNGKLMPIFGLGTWKSEPKEVVQVVKDAIDLGYRHFDCAYLYQNEHEVGEGIKAKINEGVVKREDLFITSKLWNTYHRADLVIEACSKSLNLLGVGYLDLYLIHWPMAFKEGDDLSPVDADGNPQYSNADFTDTWPQMEKCVELGLTKSIGVSNFNSKQLERVLSIAKIKPVVNQIESHPWFNQAKLLEFCKARDIVLTAYGPLGSPYRPLPKPGDIPLLEEPKLKEIAAKRGKSAAQIALRYQVQRGVIIIPKSVKKSRLEENMSVFDFTLSVEDMKAIDSLDSKDGRLCHLAQHKNHPNYPFSIEF